LPAAIDPLKLAERGSRLTGTLPLRGMPRLTEIGLEGRGEVEVDLEFGRRERDNRRVMTGRLATRLKLTCPRCLEPFELRLEANPEVVLLRPDEGQLDEQDSAEAMVVEQAMDLNQLVEDELLLALPMYPAHPEGQCPTRSAAERAGQGKRNNPFAALEALRGGPGKGKR
jgi:uncharacterized protein